MSIRVWTAKGIVLLAWAYCSVCWAQPVPSPGQLVPRPGPPVQAPTADTVIFPELPPAVLPPGAERIELTVGGIELDGGYLALDAETQAAIAGVTGRRVTVAQLYQVAARVERFYAARGYFLNRVVIPPQQVRDGQTLRMQVMAGFIEAIDVAQLPAPVQQRISRILTGLAGERRLTLAMLERKLLLAGDTPGTTLRTTITPGTQPGGVRLIVQAEHAPVSAELGFDTWYPKAFGRAAVTVGATLNSALGMGEQLYVSLAGPPSAGFLGAHSARRLGAVGVLVPLDNDGLILNVEGTLSSTRPRLPPDQLRTESDYSRISFRLLYPLIRSRTENLTPRLAFDIINETQRAPEFGAILYRDRLRVARLGASWTRRLESGTTLSLGGELSRGLPILGSRGRSDATPARPISRAAADDDFTKGELNARVHQRLPGSLALDASFYTQYALSGALLNAEQMTLGGPRRLSAYDWATFAGDHGWLARLELQYTSAFQVTPVQGLVVPYLFAARGKVYVARPTAVEPPQAGGWAVGLGLRTTVGGTEPMARDLDLQVEAARQFTDDGTQHDQWRFSLSGMLRF